MVLAWLLLDDQMDVSFPSAGVSEYVFTLAFHSLVSAFRNWYSWVESPLVSHEIGTGTVDESSAGFGGQLGAELTDFVST